MSGIGPSAWPAPQRSAFTFQSQNNTFTLPNNPTQYEEVSGTVSTDRPSVGGTITLVWTPDLRQFTLRGITEKEGIAPWIAFRNQFVGQLAILGNLLTGESTPVLVTDVTYRGVEGAPATWQWEISCQEAVQFAPASGVSTRQGGQKIV